MVSKLSNRIIKRIVKRHPKRILNEKEFWIEYWAEFAFYWVDTAGLPKEIVFKEIFKNTKQEDRQALQGSTGAGRCQRRPSGLLRFPEVITAYENPTKSKEIG